MTGVQTGALPISLVKGSPGPGLALEAHVLEEYAVLLERTNRKQEAKKTRKTAQSLRKQTESADLKRHIVDIRTFDGNTGTH